MAVTSSPADAGWPGGEIVHAGDDSGYTGRNGALFYYCDSRGVDGDLYKGQWSKSECADAGWIYVFPEEVAVCFDRFGGRREIYYPGGGVGNFAYWRCYMQLR
jgi:hypothetical protein